MNVCVLDVEATCSNPLVAKPLQVGWTVWTPDGQMLKSEYYNIKWHFPPTISEWSLENLPQECLRNEGIHMSALIKRLRTSLRDEQHILVGHNIGTYDIPLLRRYIGRETFDKLFHHRVRDTAVVCNWLADCGMIPQGGLDAHIDTFGVCNPRPHHALFDALAEARLYWASLAFGKALAECALD